MNDNNLNYQRQAKMKQNMSNQNGLYNNLNPQNNVNQNVDNNQNNSYQNGIQVGRNKPKFVKPEDYKYEIKENKVSKVDTSFTHSNINFGVEILEEQGISENDVTIEKMQDDTKETNNYYDNEKKNKKKRIIMKVILIGVVIELVLIGIIGIYKYISNQKVSNVLSCITNTVDENNKVTIEIENLYYYKKSGAYKKEVITKYAFDTKEGFDNYKKNYVDMGIYDVSGLSYENSFNTSSLTYTNKIIYEYGKMKKDKKNTSNDNNKITIKDNDGNTLIDVDILDIEKVTEDSTNQGFTCSIK